MNREQLFLETCRDLEARLQDRTLYSNLRAAALLRQLFFDAPSLLDEANKPYKLKFRFEVNNRPEIDWKAIGLPEARYEWLGDNGRGSPLRRSTLTRDQFIQHSIIQVRGRSFSTKEVVQFVAHVSGGIHAGSPKNDEHLLAELEEFGSAYLNGLLGPAFAGPAAYAVRGIAQAVLGAVRALRHAIIVSHQPTIPRVWTVGGIVREPPPNFPGKSGLLAWLGIAPPVRLGDHICLPESAVQYSADAMNRDRPAFEAAVPHRTFAIPDPGSLSPDLAGQKVGDVLVWRHPMNQPTMMAHLSEAGSRYVMAIWFEPTLPVLHFQYETLEVEIDCAWAFGLRGVAFFQWKPGQISVLYAARLASGEYKEIEAQS